MGRYRWRNWSPEYWTWPSVLLRNGGILLRCENLRGAVNRERKSGKRKGCLRAGLQLFPPLSSPAGNTSATEPYKQPTSHTLSIHVSSLESGPCLMTWTNSSHHSPKGRTGGCGHSQQSRKDKEGKCGFWSLNLKGSFRHLDIRI